MRGACEDKKKWAIPVWVTSIMPNAVDSAIRLSTTTTIAQMFLLLCDSGQDVAKVSFMY